MHVHIQKVHKYFLFCKDACAWGVGAVSSHCTESLCLALDIGSISGCFLTLGSHLNVQSSQSALGWLRLKDAICCEASLFYSQGNFIIFVFVKTVNASFSKCNCLKEANQHRVDPLSSKSFY